MVKFNVIFSLIIRLLSLRWLDTYNFALRSTTEEDHEGSLSAIQRDKNTEDRFLVVFLLQRVFV